VGGGGGGGFFTHTRVYMHPSMNILYIHTCTGTWKSCRTPCGGRRRRRIFFEHIIYTYMHRDLEELQDSMWGEQEEEDFF